MASTEDSQKHTPSNGDAPESPQSWTYPTRTCRLCLEEVPATVTLYPPGLPPAFQRPVVEYKNEDEYGRLIKPCHCRGGMRYIHELCLRRSRTEGVRPGSLWKCHECGYQFNFNRLTIQRYLGSKTASGVLTAFVMLVIIFLLGFIADPILNLYTDPYETIVGHEDVWQAVDVNDSQRSLSGWAQHFIKGMVSMGVLSFLRTMILNPFHWWNLRNTGLVTGRVSGRSATGRDRAVNISWIVVAMGILSASYFFYQWVQTIIGKSLQRIGNNIVDTQLPGDDDDIKPPPGFKFESNYPDTTSSGIGAQQSDNVPTGQENETTKAKDSGILTVGPGVVPGAWGSSAHSSALDDAQSQGWSFRGL
ncbi:uncharacterized protein A1O5_07656 [Cladophialophora psammophila CBS 110553]|uniref:RING-CH-type domain-containing protein n=1 Tax=Cladophialophora psammophila CBS 110553 TaxID=1182543 RepID=W9WX30_9EURO|nr:uncharacterized protein A1O5_07656 [Cladophialophora psammophila CBS 110553]EXJ69620.1 hypothetical protein A1O5_07656 [Cladophialophora psammophila CBS 110553]